MSVETGFEQKFGQLVDAHLNEKLPSLSNYRVGFQVIDKTDEEDRAVGIAAFVVNDVWLYVPIFFLNGDLKGSDLIYVKQRNLFVPAVDNWITTISEKGIEVLGHATDPDQHSNNFAAPEDTNVFQASEEFGKTASFDSNSLLSKEDVQDMFRMYKDASSPEALADGIEKLGPTAARKFVHTVLHDDKYANAVFVHYSPNEVENILTRCVRVYSDTEKIAAHQESVLFITDMFSKEAADLGDTEKSLLLRNGVYVKDTRTNFSKVFEEQIDTGVIQNPQGSGIYDVYMQDGTYKTFVVLLPKSYSQEPDVFRQSDNNVGRQIALIDLSSPTKYLRRNLKEVFCKPSANVTEAQMEALQGGTKASLRSMRDMAVGTDVMFVTSPDTSVETTIVGKNSSGGGELVLSLANTTGNSNKEPSLNADSGQVQLEFTGREGRLKVRGNHLFVPDQARVFTREKETKENRLSLGTPETVYHVMHKQAGISRLQLHVTPGTMHIKSAGESSGMLSRTEGLRQLIEVHGIYAGQAMHLAKRAAAAPGGMDTFLIKYAGPYDSGKYGVSKQPFMGGPSGREKYSVKETISRQTGKAHSGAKASDNSSLPGQVVEKATKASAAGIREVFDASILAGLVEVTDISELRKDYLKDMITGMDKVGRMLFIFYWHRDSFEDRYGSEDLKKLEDTLKNVFTATGDLVLFLKNKTTNSPDSAESLFGSLSEDVGTA